jgi:hypothetical protein
MRQFSILFFYSLLLYSCNYEKYKNRIQGNKGTYWNVAKRNSTVFDPPVNAWFFATDGNCIYYSLKQIPGGKYDRIEDHTNKTSSNKWSLKNDTLNIMGSEYLLYSHTGKKLKLIPLDKRNDTLELREPENRN